MSKFKKRAPYLLYKETVVNQSGSLVNFQRLSKLRKGYFYKENIDPGGDAPKSFIRVYEYGVCKKDQPKSWID